LTGQNPGRTFRLPLVAGWSSPVARQAHNLKVVGSNPTPAPNFKPLSAHRLQRFFVFLFRKIE